MREITIDKKFQGPFGSANGGYVAGLLADAAGGGDSATRLHRPVPVDEPIYLFAEDGWAALRHCDQTLAETVESTEEIATTAFVPMDQAVNAHDPEIDMGIFADCFVCGRRGVHGLGINPRQLDDSRFVAVWHPASTDVIDTEEVPERFLRSALDCPGGFAVAAESRTLAVTGSIASRVYFRPSSDQHLIVVGEAGDRDGRKLRATTTIFTESDEVVATAEATWISLEAVPISSAA